MAIPRGTELPVRQPVHPGEVLLEEFLRPMAMSQTRAAEQMAMPLNRLNEIVRGKRGVSAETALRLSELLGTSPEFWLNLQTAVDLYQAKVGHERRQSELSKASSR